MFLFKIFDNIASFWNQISPTTTDNNKALALVPKKKNKKTNNSNNGFLDFLFGENVSRHLSGIIPYCYDIFVAPKNNKILTKEPKDQKERIPPKIRNSVWLKYQGEKDIGICYACGKSINRYEGGWHAAHVRSENKLGEITVENLRTCCAHCNLSMGNQNLYAYIRDKNLQGPGRKNVNSYFRNNPSQKNDKRTNNWGRNDNKLLI